ncbi:MAG: VWA domain-containing protein [Polyangiaceae bacterium]
MGLVLFAAALAAASASCGSDSSSGKTGQGGDSQQPPTGATGGSGAGGTSGNNTDPGEIGGFGPGPGSSGSGAGGTEACAGTTVQGQLIPLDMYVLLDKSGSMGDLTGPGGNGPPKWAAVTTALKAFFADPKSAELGVGIQFFPTTLPGVPDSCTSSAQCGAGGPCLLKACELDLSFGDIVPCDSDSDCGFADSCIDLGKCQNNSGYVCIYQQPEVSCGTDPNGVSLGKCKPMQSSFCVNKDSCNAADYGAPAVEIAPLGSSAAALGDAIDARVPGGATPTGPALKGAIDHARAWAQSHPTHKVVAVIATDGMPTECSPLDIPSIAGIAQTGVAGSPGVLTFVIGVFGAADAGAQQNLDQIAQSGGTGSAFFIADNQDVTQAFLAALEAIQGETLACEYQIPAPPDGSDLDYDKVNVAYTPAGQSTPKKVYYVAKPSECDAAKGGWYYDKDPQSGAKPGKILMCPATCAELQAAGGKVEIEMGCQTIVPEPD